MLETSIDCGLPKVTKGAGMCGMSVEKIEEMRMTENKVKSDFPVDYIISMSKFFYWILMIVLVWKKVKSECNTDLKLRENIMFLFGFVTC